ncbi:MAG: hypothetical protein KF681_17340 [Bdellovibrionaceae bacterium]|nr:hypothetical protein [Pseudobdellovibrionaceae bacterium]
MNLNERTVFLLDGLGASLSAIMVGLVLPLFSVWVGLSSKSLRLLGLIAFILAGYSLICFWFVRRPGAPMLMGIILANSCYVVLTLLIVFFASELTAFGQAYFIFEVAIICGVVLLETRVYRRSFGRGRPTS